MDIKYANIKPSFLNATCRSQEERLEYLNNKEEMLKLYSEFFVKVCEYKHLKFNRSVKKMCDKITNCTGHKLLRYFKFPSIDFYSIKNKIKHGDNFVRKIKRYRHLYEDVDLEITSVLEINLDKNLFGNKIVKNFKYILYITHSTEFYISKLLKNKWKDLEHVSQLSISHRRELDNLMKNFYS